MAHGARGLIEVLELGRKAPVHAHDFPQTQPTHSCGSYTQLRKHSPMYALTLLSSGCGSSTRALTGRQLNTSFAQTRSKAFETPAGKARGWPHSAPGVAETLPKFDVEASLAFIIKPIDSRNGRALMVATSSEATNSSYMEVNVSAAQLMVIIDG